MPEPLTLQLEQSRRYFAGDTLEVEVEVDGGAAERFPLWTAERSTLGYGHGPYGRGRYGVGRSLGYGVGAYGRGRYGQGSRILTILTRAQYPEGDYDVRLRVTDALGNAGLWSDVTVIEHHPIPPAPRNLRLSGSNLMFDWTP